MLNIAEQAGTSFELVLAYAAICTTTGVFGLHRLAEAYYQRGLETAEKIGIPAARALFLVITNLYREGIGQWEQVRHQASEAHHILSTIGDKRMSGDALAEIAHAEHFLGNYSQANQHYEQLTNPKNDIPTHHIWARSFGISTAWRQGNFDQALQLGQAALALPYLQADRPSHINILGALAAVHLRCGHYQQAQELADQAADMIAATKAVPTSYWSIDGYIGTADTYLGLWQQNGRTATLVRSAQQACRALRTFTRLFPLGKPAAWLYQGCYHWLAQQNGRAHKAWQKSLTTAQQLHLPYEEARAHYEIGYHLHNNTHLHAAHNIFARIQANYDLKLTQEALQQHNTKETT